VESACVCAGALRAEGRWLIGRWERERNGNGSVGGKCLSGCSTTRANWLFLVPQLSDVELDAVMRNHQIEQWVHRQPTDLRVDEGCNSEWARERQKVVQGEGALRTERSRAR